MDQGLDLEKLIRFLGEEGVKGTLIMSVLGLMAPPNGRAVLLFRSTCGCPIAKLQGWGSKKGKRHKRYPPNASLHGRGDKKTVLP